MSSNSQMTSTLQTFATDTQAAARSNMEIVGEMTRQSGEAMRVAGDAMRQGVQAAVEGQRELIQYATKQLMGMSQKMTLAVQNTTEQMRTLTALPTSKGGMQDLQQSVIDLFERTLRINVNATQELFRLYSSSSFMGLQQRIAREYLGTIMEGNAALTRVTREQRLQHAAE